MTTFDAGQHPRGAAGKFAAKHHQDATVSLTDGDDGGDGPTVVHPNGVQEWLRDGKSHRDGVPACVDPDGTEAWYQDGKLHRDDGPAVTWADGTQEWWKDGRPAPDPHIPGRSAEVVEGWPEG